MIGISRRLAYDAVRNPSIMSAQPVGVLVAGRRAALAVDGSDAVLGDLRRW